MKEIERKWRVITDNAATLKRNLSRRKGSKVEVIEQIYLSESPEVRIRKRTAKDGSFKVIKGEKSAPEKNADQSLFIREEKEWEVDKKEWENALRKFPQNYIKKTRITLATGEEFDFFDFGVLMEKEFPTKSQAKRYSPPKIAGIKKYTSFLFSNLQLVQLRKQLQQEVEGSLGKSFKVIAQPRAYKTPIKIKAPDCGHVFSLVGQYIKDAKGCKICEKMKLSKSMTTPDDKLVEMVNKRANYKFVKKDKGYKNSRSGKIIVLHEECGKTFSVSPHNFKAGRGCSHCAYIRTSSRPMRIFKKMLEESGISFKEEMEALRNPETGAALRWDFFIPEINVAVEIDGGQHYKPVKRFGGLDAFQKTVFRDNLKDEFAKSNGIHLIRIPLVTKELKDKRAAEIRQDLTETLSKIKEMLREKEALVA